MVDSMSTRCRQRIGVLHHGREFLGPRGFIVAYKSLRDLSVNMAVLPSWVLQPPIYLNLTQKMAERFCGCEFPSLHSRRKASAVGLLCKLLDS